MKHLLLSKLISVCKASHLKTWVYRTSMKKRKPITVLRVRFKCWKSKKLGLSKKSRRTWGWVWVSHNQTFFACLTLGGLQLLSVIVACKNCKIAQQFKEKAKGDQFANDAEALMGDVYFYLEKSDGVCQFILNKLMDQIKGDYRPDKIQSKLV